MPEFAWRLGCFLLLHSSSENLILAFWVQRKKFVILEFCGALSALRALSENVHLVQAGRERGAAAAARYVRATVCVGRQPPPRLRSRRLTQRRSVALGLGSMSEPALLPLGPPEGLGCRQRRRRGRERAGGGGRARAVDAAS